MPNVFFAPMEALTEAPLRRAHRACFSGVTAYYMPFISPTKHLVLTGREKQNVLPQFNAGVPCVPQALTCDEAHFLWAAHLLADMGYEEIDLNAGCPSSTVVAKGKGAGMLRDPKALDYFLEDVCAHSPLPVSVKMRIGFDRPGEWAALLAAVAQYPLRRLIIHPRTFRDRYDPGTLHMDCWQDACRAFRGELVYNGDLFSLRDVQEFRKRWPQAGLMLGRGLVADPSLARQIAGGSPLRREEAIAYHDRLLQELLSQYTPHLAHVKLRVVMKHLACCFEASPDLLRRIRASEDLDALLLADRELLEDCPMKVGPSFVPDAPTPGKKDPAPREQSRP